MTLASKLKTATLLAGVMVFSLIGTAAAATNTAATTANQQQRLANIKSRGAAEITRRLNSLNSVASRINSMTHLTTSDKTTLTDEVNTEISGLTALQTKLAADTTLADASADAQSIVSDYRVYALILPKVWLVKTADDQQTTEAKLTSLAQNLQTRISSAQSNNQNVGNLPGLLSDMNTQISSAQAISTAIEQQVISLQPSDYNSNRSVLSGDATQLKTAHSDNQAAFNDAKQIIAGLKAL